jgi:hypothetical protein
MAESDVRSLFERSLDIYDMVVGLKREARSLKYANISSFEASSRLIAGFCREHVAELRAVEGYVHWLSEGNPRRPSILWSYKPVGSTNRMLRSPPFEEDGGASVPPALTLRDATQYVVNAYQADHATDDWHDEPEGARLMAVEFAEYWSLLRESVQAVIAECQSQERILALIDDETFWARFAREVVLTAPAETETWDVKRTLEAWHCEPSERLAKEVQFVERAAAFANAGGGAILIGIGDRAPREVYGVPDYEHRATNIRSLLQRLAGLDSSLVKVLPFQLQTVGGLPRTCLAVVVAQTTIPIGVNNGNGTFSYPIRRGSDTELSNREAIQRNKDFASAGAANFGVVVRLAGRIAAG